MHQELLELGRLGVKGGEAERVAAAVEGSLVRWCAS